jgi:hypothetical protein
MAPVAAFVANERICAPQQDRRSRELDWAVAPPLAATLVRRARSKDLRPLLELAQTLIGGEHATEDAVRRVAIHRPDSIWAFVHGTRMVGVFAMLLLNTLGLESLLARGMNTRDPSVGLLATPAEAPAGIYLWAVAHSSASDGILQMFERLQISRYCSADIFAVPATDSGLRFLRGWGFQSLAGHPRNLHHYVRLTNRRHKLGG